VRGTLAWLSESEIEKLDGFENCLTGVYRREKVLVFVWPPAERAQSCSESQGPPRRESDPEGQEPQEPGRAEHGVLSPGSARLAPSCGNGESAARDSAITIAPPAADVAVSRREAFDMLRLDPALAPTSSLYRAVGAADRRNVGGEQNGASPPDGGSEQQNGVASSDEGSRGCSLEGTPSTAEQSFATPTENFSEVSPTRNFCSAESGIKAADHSGGSKDKDRTPVSDGGPCLVAAWVYIKNEGGLGEPAPGYVAKVVRNLELHWADHVHTELGGLVNS